MRTEQIPVPSGWPERVADAVRLAVALAHWSMVWTRSWCLNSRVERVRLRGEVERLQAEVALLKEELRIKDERMARIPPRNRPHYPPQERLAILLLKAARGWSAAVAARRFLLTPPTVAEWQRRLEREGEQALVRLPVAVNRFPDFVREVARQLRTLVPAMGSGRIADLLARAGLHLSKTSVRRFIAERPQPEGDVPRPGVAVGSNCELGAAATRGAAPQRTVTARYPNHVWNCDLTMVPIFGGFWVPWRPLALPPIWPFCWWVAAVVDHHSRRVLAWRIYLQQPSATQVVGLLDVARLVAGGAPRHMVTDQGSQFREEYRAWCTAHGVKPRYGAVGRYGSIALIERFWATLKGEGLRRLAVVPLRAEAMRREVELFVEWYNGERPHSALGGRTPDEAWSPLPAARDGPRFECRARWPLGEEAALRAEQGAVVELAVAFLGGRRHLPVVGLKRAA